MPITIKSTELKYKNPSTGQYQGIDAVAERTTSEQCALIEAKGAETIASIPSDYTTLSGTVDDLTSDVSNLNGAIYDNQNNIAKVETGNTATQNYLSGDYVIVNGNLYKVITSISSGNTFTIGTNISAAKATDAIKETVISASSFNFNHVTASAEFSAIRTGNRLFLDNAELTVTDNINAWTQIGTMYSIKPKTTAFTRIVNKNDADAYVQFSAGGAILTACALTSGSLIRIQSLSWEI